MPVTGILSGEGLAFGQSTGVDLRFVPQTFYRISDSVGQPASQTYLFSPAPGSFEIDSRLRFTLSANGDQHTFLGGPEYHFAIGKRLTFTAWAKGGEIKRFALMNPFKDPVSTTPPHFGLYPSATAIEPAFNGANQFGMSFGGSVDYKVRDSLSVRVIQSEYLYMQLMNSYKGSTRISTGLRFSFGK